MPVGRTNRRAFIAGLGGAAAWPAVLWGQQPIKPKVGYVSAGEPGTDVSARGFRQGLADKGYVIGRNLALEERYAHGESEKVPALVAELLALKVDVLATVGTFACLAGRRATATVPIVCASGDPVKTGLAASLNRPGSNVTGVSTLVSDYSAKWLELMKEALPNLHRVAALWNPDNVAVGQVDQLHAAARALGLDVTTFLGSPKEIDSSLARIANGNFDGLVVATDPTLEALIPRLMAFAAAHRLPACYPFSNAVQQGGLMSYSIDFFEIWRRAASYVDRILKGESPADLPIEQATRLMLKINLKTAKTLGIAIPPTLFARADEVIE